MRFVVIGAGLLCMALGAVWPATGAENPAQGEGNYGETLSRVYFAHQRLLALREACDQALPEQAALNAGAYGAWQARHRTLLEELDARLNQMIRGASKDEKEYIRNLGRYEGSIMEYRSGHREQILGQPRDGIGQMCADFRGYLAGSGSDFRREYADELRLLRRRELPKQP